MDLNSEKKRPQLVEVVNNSANPTQTEIINFPLSAQGALVVSGSISTAFVRPTIANTFVVSLDNILLLQGDGTFVPIPLNSVYSNITTANLNAMLAGYKTAYATLVSGVTAATLHYSKLNQTGVVTSEVYNLKD